MDIQQLQGTYNWLIPSLIILFIWETIWKLFAMWKAGRNNHLAWFVCIALINTIGILPFIYILMHRKKSNNLNKI